MMLFARLAGFRCVQRRGGFALPELLVALLVLGITLLGVVSLQGELLRRQQSLWRDQFALDLARELDERKQAQPDISCQVLSRSPGTFAVDAADVRSWRDALHSRLPAAHLLVREDRPGCRLEIDYPRPHGMRGKLLWE